MTKTILSVVFGTIIGLSAAMGFGAIASSNGVHENARVDPQTEEFEIISGVDVECKEVKVEEYDLTTGLMRTLDSIQVCKQGVDK